MAAPQGIATYPGVNQIIGATYTLQHGITPGVAILTIAPQAKLPADGGTLRFLYGGVSIAIPDCQLDSLAVHADNQQRIVQVSILDRRWRWRECGAVSGVYNVFHDDGTLDRSTEATPQQLLASCLNALDEHNFRIASVPNLARPSVDWDVDLPAHAMQRLVDDLGCRIFLDNRGRVTIAPAGIGRRLPVLPSIMNASGTADPPERPLGLVLFTAPTRFQYDFTLEAVGKDVDGTIRKIDELSYKPENGWENCSGWFGEIGLDEDETDDDKPLPAPSKSRALAEETVGKWYRIKEQVPLIENLFGYGQVDSINQILPIEAEQVALERIEVFKQSDPARSTFREVNLPAVVWGAYMRGNDFMSKWEAQQPEDVANLGMNTTDDELTPKAPADSRYTRYMGPFSIDRELGIVMFAEQVWFLIVSLATGVFVPADLRLRCAFHVRHAKTRAIERFARGFRLPGGKGIPRFIVRNDVQLGNRSATEVEEATNNIAEVQAACDYYLDQAEREYQFLEPASAQYAGIIPFELDGAIQSITWSVGREGATTRVSRNDERTNPFVPTYRRRKVLEQLAVANKLAREQAQLANRVRKAAPQPVNAGGG